MILLDTNRNDLTLSDIYIQTQKSRTCIQNIRHLTLANACVSFFVHGEQTEPFLKPVSLEQHPDYAEYIFHAMDLSTLEKVTLN